MTLTRRAMVATAFLAAPAAALAHHGWGGFDTSKPLDHTGSIVRSTYANPHGTLFMARDGREIVVELAPVNRMDARGLKADDVAPGKSLRVYAYQNVGNPSVYRAEWVEVAGKRIELR
jgi:hypothetical protein